MPIIPSNKGDSGVPLEYEPPVSLSDAFLCLKKTNLTLPELLALDVFTYRIILINVYVEYASQTDEGVESLNRWSQLFEQDNTQMDVASLERLSGKFNIEL